MPVLTPDVRLPGRGHGWKWWVCGLLLLATMINYMDRLTFNLLAEAIKTDLSFDVLHYGHIESAFAVAFAFGAVLFGLIVDRWNVFWVYPLAVLAWSAAGFFSGFAQGFFSLLVCRFLLGLAESANWPCALRTTQRILPPGERTMGNSILQSGAAFGAILIPSSCSRSLTPPAAKPGAAPSWWWAGVGPSGCSCGGAACAGRTWPWPRPRRPAPGPRARLPWTTGPGSPPPCSCAATARWWCWW